MIIKNLTKKSILATKSKYALSIKDRLGGFILKQNVEALVFKTRFGIHTFGMNRSIDVLILDRLHKVTIIRKNLKPNKLFFWNPKYMWVIELPKGAIGKSFTTLGDQIYFDLRS